MICLQRPTNETRSARSGASRPLDSGTWLRPVDSRLERDWDGLVTDNRVFLTPELRVDVQLELLEDSREVDLSGRIRRLDGGAEETDVVDVVLIDKDRNAPSAVLRIDPRGEFAWRIRRDATFGLRLGTHIDAPCLLLTEGS